MTKPNIVLIVLDTVRQKTFKNLLENGFLQNIERIVQEGTMFTSASANGAWTLPTHASIFTGKRVSRHGAHAGTKSFNPDSQTLPELLSTNNYRTVGISGNTWISPMFGFDRGFDKFSMKWDYFWRSADLTPAVDAEGLRSKFESLYNEVRIRDIPTTTLNALYSNFLANRHDDGAQNITRRAVKWIQKIDKSEQPFFFFLNYFEPHLEYTPIPEYRKKFVEVSNDHIESINQDPWEYLAGKSKLDRSDFDILRSLYKAEIAYLDEKIGKIYQELENKDILNNTCIVIVGDHGENIGDHDLMDHQYCLYETLLNVPLLIRIPGRESNEVVQAPVETRDIYTTLLNIAEIDPPSNPNISSNRLDSSPGREYVIGEYRAPQPSMESIKSKFGSVPQSFRKYDRALRSIRTGRWKLIEGSDGTIELYNLETEENTNRSQDFPEIVDQLSSILDMENIPKSKHDINDASVGTTTQKRLKDLGYL